MRRLAAGASRPAARPASAAAVSSASHSACAVESGRSSFQRPVAAVDRPGPVHPRLAAEPEQVLRRDDHELVLDGEHVLQQRPVLVGSRRSHRRRAAAGSPCPSAATSRRACPSRGWRCTGPSRCASRRPRPGRRRSCPAGRAPRAAAITSGVMWPRSSRISGRPPKPLASRVEERHARALAPGSLRRVVLVERQLPELHEAAEVVDAQQVEQLQLALEPRQPPGDSRRPRGPASRTPACPSAGPPDGSATAPRRRRPSGRRGPDG